MIYTPLEVLQILSHGEVVSAESIAEDIFLNVERGTNQMRLATHRVMQAKVRLLASGWKIKRIRGRKGGYRLDDNQARLIYLCLQEGIDLISLAKRGHKGENRLTPGSVKSIIAKRKRYGDI